MNMDIRRNLLNNVMSKLGYLKSQVILANSLNLTDLNIHGENFYRDFLKHFGYNCKNINAVTLNASSIDLVDDTKKIVIQVTSQNDNKKINETLKKFRNNKTYTSYKLKLLLIAKESKNYTTKFKDGFDPDSDIIDIPSLLAEIQNKEIQQIEEISNFLDSQIVLKSLTSNPNEVETILALIEFLSDRKNRIVLKLSNDVDPEKKIYKRFADHSEFLTNQYLSLNTIYKNSLMAARDTIDTLEAPIISGYLQDLSNNYLTKYNDNPKESLEKLTDFFCQKLSVNGTKFDNQAIKYYLIDELINCNVFPNP